MGNLPVAGQALDTVEAYPRSQHQAVIGQPAPGLQFDLLARAIYPLRPVLEHPDAVAVLQGTVIKGQIADPQSPVQHQVAHNAGHMPDPGFHQRDVNSRAAPQFQVFGQGRPGEAAADHDYLVGLRALHPGHHGDGRRGRDHL